MDPLGFPPPTLKPQPPPPSPSSVTSFPILAISIVGILATSILLLSYYVFVIKCCLNWHHSEVFGRPSRSRGRRPDPSMSYSTTTENLGLDESTIRAIPTFRYRKMSENSEGRSFHECAVCLNEFKEEEKIRLLPNCLHVFHIDCIDTWLQTNAKCPLCRSSVKAPIPTDHVMALAAQYDPYRRNDVVIEVRDVGSDPTQTVTSTSTSPRKPEQSIGHKKNRKLQYLSSRGDECIDVREKDEQFCVQPMRRSFSMDSSGDRQLYIALQRILQQKSHCQDVSGESSSSSSSSSRLRRSFFSFSRSSRGVVLPLHIEL